MLSRTTTFLASTFVIAIFSACSNPYSDVYSFKKNKFQAPKEQKTEISIPAGAANPLQGQTAPMTDPSMGIPGVPSATPVIPGIPGLPEAAPAPAPSPMPIEATPGTPPATTPVPAPGTPPATTPAPGATPAIPGL